MLHPIDFFSSLNDVLEQSRCDSSYRSYTVEESENGLSLKFKVPGVAVSDLKVECVGQKLIVKAPNYLEKLSIGASLDSTQAKVTYQYGVLTVSIPYKEKTTLDIEVL